MLEPVRFGFLTCGSPLRRPVIGSTFEDARATLLDNGTRCCENEPQRPELAALAGGPLFGQKAQASSDRYQQTSNGTANPTPQVDLCPFPPVGRQRTKRTAQNQILSILQVFIRAPVAAFLSRPQSPHATAAFDSSEAPMFSSLNRPAGQSVFGAGGTSLFGSTTVSFLLSNIKKRRTALTSMPGSSNNNNNNRNSNSNFSSYSYSSSSNNNPCWVSNNRMPTHSWAVHYGSRAASQVVRFLASPPVALESR